MRLFFKLSIIIIAILLLLTNIAIGISSMTNTKLDCIYSIMPNKFTDRNLGLSMIIDTQQYYQCPPTLKMIFKLKDESLITERGNMLDCYYKSMPNIFTDTSLKLSLNYDLDKLYQCPAAMVLFFTIKETKPIQKPEERDTIIITEEPIEEEVLIKPESQETTEEIAVIQEPTNTIAKQPQPLFTIKYIIVNSILLILFVITGLMNAHDFSLKKQIV